MRRIRFVVVFLLLLALFEIPLLVDSVDRNVVRPFTTGIAHVSGAVIASVSKGVQVNGTMIIGTCFSVDIRNGCNGLEASLFLLAAILAFPAATRIKVLGAVSGFALVQLANLVRIVSLYFIGCYRPQWFEAFHLAIWQSIIFAIIYSKQRERFA